MAEKPKILHVDDNEVARYAIGRLLENAGFDVLHASTGAEALRIAATGQPDLVLLDVHLPDINGLEVCRRIKSDPLAGSMPVVQISAAAVSARDVAESLEGGADSYLREPLEPEALVATVKAMLRTKRAEDALRESIRRWQDTFDAINDGIVLTAADGRIVRLNAAAKTMAGTLDLGALIGNLFARTKETGTRQIEDVLVGEQWFHVKVDPVSGANGSLAGSVCVISDITERQRLEEEYRQAQKMEGIAVLAGGVAHDFNNILTGVMGNASLAVFQSDEGSPVQQRLQDIIRASERAADLTRQLLAYAGKGRFVVQPADLSDLVHGIRRILDAAVPKRIELKTDLKSDLPKIDADARQIQQLIMNLVQNSVEAIGESHGTIRISTGLIEEPPSMVCLEVEDTGCGMSEETQAQMFDPFFTTKFMGRGLGLSAAAGIVRGHDGEIRVSSSPGEGSTFRVLFPPRPAEIAKAGPLQGSGTVLIIDDEEIVRRMASVTLELYGYEVLLAENGARGIELFRQHAAAISTVLLDVAMPVMSGEEALREMARIRPDTKVIVTSGYDESEAIRRFRGQQVRGFLQKPFTSRQLAEKIKEVADSSGHTT